VQLLEADYEHAREFRLLIQRQFPLAPSVVFEVLKIFGGYSARNLRTLPQIDFHQLHSYFLTFNCDFWPCPLASLSFTVAENYDTKKKRPAVAAERCYVSRRQSEFGSDPLVNYFDKLRVTRANHTFGVGKTVHVNRDPAGVHEHEICVAD
jgi:hypothetical protein